MHAAEDALATFIKRVHRWAGSARQVAVIVQLEITAIRLVSLFAVVDAIFFMQLEEFVGEAGKIEPTFDQLLMAFPPCLHFFFTQLPEPTRRLR